MRDLASSPVSANKTIHPENSKKQVGFVFIYGSNRRRTVLFRRIQDIMVTFIFIFFRIHLLTMPEL